MQGRAKRFPVIVPHEGLGVDAAELDLVGVLRNRSP